MLFDMPSGTLPSSSTPSAVPRDARTLGDRGVHPTVHDAHRLADGRCHRQARGAEPDLDEVVDLEADHRVEGVLERAAASGSGPSFDTLVTRPMLRAAATGGRQMAAGTWESHHAITTLMFRYAECVDAADFDGIAALFADARITNEGVAGAIVGPDAVRKLYERTNRVHEDGTTRTRHMNSNVIIDINESEGQASARSSFVVFQQTAALPLQPIVSGPLPRHVRAQRPTTGASTAATSSSTTSATCAST